ncbi:hypothetical protein ACP26L_12310 [Paenibacillus sp. S-38]|uniref:Y-family DNA polymerase n=1 Tax=Paenibacillus sp. S-38 TaxID=3416710 RepID=UPI003CF98495
MKYDTSSFPRVPVFCIDSKSFYASVECIRRGLPPLETFLVVIGDASRSGSVVLAASPPMKKNFGIKTGSRYYEVPRDPRIHVVEASMSTYLEFSISLPRLNVCTSTALMRAFFATIQVCMEPIFRRQE